MTPVDIPRRPASISRGRTAAWADELKVLDRRARAFATQHPFVALTAAVCAGYLVGRVSIR